MTMLIVAFRNFANASKTCQSVLYMGIIAVMFRSQYEGNKYVFRSLHLFPFRYILCPNMHRFQVATTCFLRSPPDLNLVVINFIFCIHVK